MSNQETYAIRLKPGSDLKHSLQIFVNEKKLQAAWIVTCVGSLTDHNIRFADQPTGTIGSGHFEILNLAGVLSVNGSHIHICISDSSGKTIGGHLMDGNIIYTTAEIIIQGTDKYIFKRENDGSSLWKELRIEEPGN